MHILEVNTESGWRGGEKQTLLTAIGLQQAGETISLLCKSGSALAGKGADAHLSMVTCSGFMDFFRFLAFEGRKFDVIHLHTAKDLTLAVLTKWFHRRPLVYSRRVAFTPKGSLTLWKYRQTREVIAVSEAVKQVMEDFLARPVPVIPDAVLVRSPSRERALAFLAGGGISAPLYLGTMAALTPEKDPFTMLEAIRLLAEKREDFVFLHFGEGPLRPELEKRIREGGLQNRYFLPGFVEDVEDFYSILSVFAMSSAQEGLGSSALEAMAYGVPVVSTEAGGLKETVGKFGCTSPVGNAPALASNLEKALSASTQSTEKARKWVLETFGLREITRRYIEVFRTAAS